MEIISVAILHQKSILFMLSIYRAEFRVNQPGKCSTMKCPLHSAWHMAGGQSVFVQWTDEAKEQFYEMRVP